jgi:hypothetical protein
MLAVLIIGSALAFQSCIGNVWRGDGENQPR